MSREHTYYDVNCQPCGNTGELDYWDDDWNRWGTSWTGFRQVHFFITRPTDAVAECLKCGQRDITIERRRDA